MRQKVPKEVGELEIGSELKVLSFNAFCRPPGIKNKENDWKSERLEYMAKNEMPKYDVVGFQELFGTFSGRRDHFLRLCADSGHAHYVTSPKPSWKYLIDGGLAIVSKYEIVESNWKPFVAGVHSDRLAEKGVLHAKLCLNASLDIYIHIFTAHTQSSYNDPKGTPSWKVRERQTQMMLDFISLVTSGDSYPAILMGDLNIDARKDLPHETSSSEYKIFLQQLQELKSQKGAHDPSPSPFATQDLLFEFNNFQHPVTFGDATIGPDGSVCPLETIFTKPHDYGSSQSLDYIFWMTRSPSHSSLLHPEAQKDEISHSTRLYGDKREATRSRHSHSSSQPLSLVPKSASVAKLMVKNQPFTQLSDHYGAEAVFHVV